MQITKEQEAEPCTRLVRQHIEDDSTVTLYTDSHYRTEEHRIKLCDSHFTPSQINLYSIV